MMDRNAVHKQIATLADKITFLNERLAKEQRLHPVEADLLSGYAIELHNLTHQLAADEDFTGNQPAGESINVFPSQPATPEKQKVHSHVDNESEEIKLHQHISANAELPADDPDATLLIETKTMEVTVAESVPVKTTRSNEPNAAGKKAVSLNEKFKIESKPLSDKLKSVKKKNLKELFDLNERYSLIEKLFGGSADRFNKVMHDLGKCASREEAESYIKNAEVKFAWQDKKAFADRFAAQVLGVMDAAESK